MTAAESAALALTKFDVPGAYSDLAWNHDFDQYRQPASDIGLGWQAKVLGGGGLTNGALTMRPPSTDLERLPSGWRAALEAQFALLEADFGGLTTTPSTDGMQHGNATRELLQQGMRRLHGTRVVRLDDDPDGRVNTLSLPTVTARGGVRQSTASVHLERARQSARFELRLEATVTRVQLDAAGRAVGVVYVDAAGATYTAGLAHNGRLVLTAGALATPRLLWLSGIGPPAELEALRASSHLEVEPARWIASPGVGAYLSDHVISTLTFASPDAALAGASSSPAEARALYTATRAGLLAQYGPTAVGYLRCDECSPPSVLEDVEFFVSPATRVVSSSTTTPSAASAAAGATAAGGAAAAGTTAPPSSALASTFRVALMLLAPSSESRLTVASGSARAVPLEYGDVYLPGNGPDIDVMASAAIKVIRAVLAADANVSLRNLGYNSWGNLPACDTADGHCSPGEAPPLANLRSWLAHGWDATSNNRQQVNHFAGTCALGECASAADGKVAGTANVHVADGSLLRHQLRAHPPEHEFAQTAESMTTVGAVEAPQGHYDGDERPEPDGA